MTLSLADRYNGTIAALEWVGSYEIENPNSETFDSITISDAFDQVKSLSNAFKYFPEAPHDMLIAYDMLRKQASHIERRIEKLEWKKHLTLRGTND